MVKLPRYEPTRKFIPRVNELISSSIMLSAVTTGTWSPSASNALDQALVRFEDAFSGWSR